MKNSLKSSIILIAIILLIWLFVETKPAMATGFLGFFWSILTDFGKWVSITLVGGTIKNTLEFLASFVNQNMIKPDYWGALYGTTPPLVFKNTSPDGISYPCLSPDPTRWYRESVNSRWNLEPKAEEFVEFCWRAMFSKGAL